MVLVILVELSSSSTGNWSSTIHFCQEFLGSRDHQCRQPAFAPKSDRPSYSFFRHASDNVQNAVHAPLVSQKKQSSKMGNFLSWPWLYWAFPNWGSPLGCSAWTWTTFYDHGLWQRTWKALHISRTTHIPVHRCTRGPVKGLLWNHLDPVPKHLLESPWSTPSSGGQPKCRGSSCSLSWDKPPPMT